MMAQSRFIVGRTQLNQTCEFPIEKVKDCKCICRTTIDCLAATAITDNDYPTDVMNKLLNKLILDFREAFSADPEVYENAEADFDEDSFPWQQIHEYFKKWQDPNKADGLDEMEQHMEQLQEVMKKSLSDVLKQGESLDTLMEKSKDISMVTHDFHKRAHKQNSGCFSCFGC